MPSKDDSAPSADPSSTLANRPRGGSPLESTPATFTSEAELLLKHLKLGAARPDPSATPVPEAAPAPRAANEFPHISGYEIECELGRGGMGVVYKARHAALRHTVAIKMILASAHAAPGEVARFVAEAEAVAQVKHPNVVRVFDLGAAAGPGPDAGRPYFVMEFVDGGNLALLLKDSGPLEPEIAAELIAIVARGVHAANGTGIVHRDLKPGNILLGKDEGGAPDGPKSKSKSGSATSFVFRHSAFQPKVSDFGLAKRLSSDLTRTQAVMGTPAYMAPEQAGGKAKFVGPQADVYALGVILYQCLTGSVPFDDPDPWALIRRVLEDSPEPPRARAPHVPRDLELICLKCLEKEPHHRYPTAAALAADLENYLAGRPVTVRPIGAPTRLARWAQKHPARAALWVVGLLLVVAVPAVAVGVKGWADHETAVRKGAEQTAFEAQRAEEAARRAEDEANRARSATEQLARANELFALRNEMRTRASERPLEWATNNLGQLPRAISLVGGDRAVLEDLRSVAAVALLTNDVMTADPMEAALTAAVLAPHPRSGLIAAGEQKSRGNCRVQLLDPVTGKTVERLTYATTAAADQDGTRALAFGPDGKWLFVGTRYSGIVRLALGVSQTEPARTWAATSGAVAQLAVSPNGKVVYGLCAEPAVLAWDADTGKKLRPFTPPDGGHANGIAVLPSGDLIAVAGNQLHQWRADGRLVRSAAAPGAGRVAVGPGSVLLIGAGPRLEVFDRHALERTDAFTDPTLRRSAHEERVSTIAVHPTGAFAATAAADTERAVKVWELASGRLLATVAVGGTGPIGIAWSGTGEHLLATAGGRVSRWRFVSSGAERFECSCGAGLAAATFTPAGRVAALAEALNGRREITGVGAPDGTQIDDPKGVEHPSLAVAPEGTVFLATGSGGAIWKPGTGVRPADLSKAAVSFPRISPDGRALWAVVDSKTVRAFDPVALTERGVWTHSPAKALFGVSTIDALAVGRIGAVAGGREGGVYVIDAKCEPVAKFHQLLDPVLAVAIAPDDSFVAAGTQSGKLRLMRLADKTELPAIPAHPGGVAAVAISRDGELIATGGRDRSVRLWKRSGDRFESLLTVSDLSAAVRKLHFSPTDGRLLVLLAHEHAVRVWDVTRLNEQLGELKLGW